MIVARSLLVNVKPTITPLSRWTQKLSTFQYPSRKILEKLIINHPLISDYVSKSELPNHLATAFANQKISQHEIIPLITRTIEDWSSEKFPPIEPEIIHLLESITEQALKDIRQP